MRRWFAFAIGGVAWTVVLARREEFAEDGEELDGLCDPRRCVIFVNEEVALGGQDAVEELVLHELEHALAIASGSSLDSFHGAKGEERHLLATTPLRYQVMSEFGLRFPPLPGRGKKR